jgi:hypothetical protein
MGISAWLCETARAFEIEISAAESTSRAPRCSLHAFSLSIFLQFIYYIFKASVQAASVYRNLEQSEFASTPKRTRESRAVAVSCRSCLVIPVQSAALLPDYPHRYLAPPLGLTVGQLRQRALDGREKLQRSAAQNRLERMQVRIGNSSLAVSLERTSPPSSHSLSEIRLSAPHLKAPAGFSSARKNPTHQSHEHDGQGKQQMECISPVTVLPIQLATLPQIASGSPQH